MVDLRCIIAVMRPSITPISAAGDRASHRPAARHATRDRNPLEPLLLAVGTHVAPHCSPLIVRAPNSSLLTSLVSGSPARRAAPGLRQEGRSPMYQPQSVITTAAEVKALLGPDFESQVAKIIDHIDPHCQSWIQRCPFIVVSSIAATGSMDVSPKGDPPGFVKVLDKHTLAIPDRLGNHRGDTFLNVLQNPNVGIVFIVPRRREVVRISGTAQIVRDRDLLESMTVQGKEPDLALLVRVKEAFFHCGKSMMRSGMWEPERWGSVDGLPTYAQALKDHGQLSMSLHELEQRVANNEAHRLY